MLARACKYAGIDFDGSAAHSALYDTQKTAELFCYILNEFAMLVPNICQDDSDGESESNSNNEEVNREVVTDQSATDPAAMNGTSN